MINIISLRKLQLHQGGDTIVEVLIATTIIAVLLSVGYSVALTSFNNELRSQERGEALQLVQSQIENLRTYLSTEPFNATTAQSFCLIDSPTGLEEIPSGSADCQVNSDGTSTTTVPYFILTITSSPVVSPATNIDFTVQAVWPNPAGAGNQYLTIYYNDYVT